MAGIVEALADSEGALAVSVAVEASVDFMVVEVSAAVEALAVDMARWPAGTAVAAATAAAGIVKLAAFGDWPWTEAPRATGGLCMNESLFPSGPWTGFYNYYPGDRHRMDLHLNFASGILSGDGSDDVGRFRIKGRYDAGARQCHWTKSYLGAHDVFYQGYREGKGIWGTWEIGKRFRGGFHIWPRESGEGEIKAEIIELAEPVDAVGTVFSPSSCIEAGSFFGRDRFDPSAFSFAWPLPGLKAS
jgi:hypothetical protein